MHMSKSSYMCIWKGHACWFPLPHFSLFNWTYIYRALYWCVCVHVGYSMWVGVQGTDVHMFLFMCAYWILVQPFMLISVFTVWIISSWDMEASMRCIEWEVNTALLYWVAIQQLFSNLGLHSTLLNIDRRELRPYFALVSSPKRQVSNCSLLKTQGTILCLNSFLPMPALLFISLFISKYSSPEPCSDHVISSLHQYSLVKIH